MVDVLIFISEVCLIAGTSVDASLIIQSSFTDSGVCTKASLTKKEEEQCRCHQYTPRPVGPWSACLVTNPSLTLIQTLIHNFAQIFNHLAFTTTESVLHVGFFWARDERESVKMFSATQPRLREVVPACSWSLDIQTSAGREKDLGERSLNFPDLHWASCHLMDLLLWIY